MDKVVAWNQSLAEVQAILDATPAFKRYLSAPGKWSPRCRKLRQRSAQRNKLGSTTPSMARIGNFRRSFNDWRSYATTVV